MDFPIDVHNASKCSVVNMTDMQNSRTPPPREMHLTHILRPVPHSHQRPLFRPRKGFGFSKNSIAQWKDSLQFYLSLPYNTTTLWLLISISEFRKEWWFSCIVRERGGE